MIMALRVTVVFTVLCCLATPLIATDPPTPEFAILRNTGEPLRVPFACAEKDLEAAGMQCSEDEPCAIYLEPDATAIAGKKIFVGGNIHSTSATISSVLLGSEDGGASWKEVAPRIIGASLEQLEFHDLDHGWASGETQYPIARDPFFLISSNGGASWQNQPVSDEGGPGSAQRFWFDSPQHGELVVDSGHSNAAARFRDYESDNGGMSWALRGSSREAPKLGHAPTFFDNPDFRTVAAAGSKTFQIEKRVGEKWETVASFLIEIASCKVAASALPEPPPDDVHTPNDVPPPTGVPVPQP